jgi:TP901 family phage tail tape measure protein
MVDLSAFKEGIVIAITSDTSGLKTGLSEADAALDKTQKKSAGVTGALKKNSKAIGLGMTAAGAAIVGSFGLATSASVDFEKQMGEVFTLLPNLSGDAKDQMSDDVRDLSVELGVTTGELIPALYQAISAGVPPDNVFEFLKTANAAAVGGVTDLTTAVDGITSVTNAYGDDIISAAEASDLMFTAVKLGKTNFEELSSSLYNVIPTAAGLDLEFSNVTAAIAAMTAQGVPTAQATTQIRQALVELSKDGSGAAEQFKELSGKSFKDFIASGGDLQGALEIMKGGAEDMDLSISDMFSSVEAGNAALSLTSEQGAKALSTALEEMDSSSGAANKAFETMDEGAGRSMEKIMASFEDLKLELGDVFLPILKDDILPIFKDLLELFKGIPDEIKPIIVVVGALGAAFVVLGPLLVALPTLITGVSTALTILSAHPIILVVAGLALLLMYLQTRFNILGKAIEIITGIFDVISNAVSVFTDWISGAVDGVDIFGAAMDVLSGIVSFFGDVWEAVSDTVSGIWSALVGDGEDTKGALETIWSWTPLGVITGHWDEISGFLSGAWDTISETAGGALDGLGDMFSNAWSGISDGASNWASDMSGTFVNAIDTAEGIMSPFVEMLPEEYQSMFGDIGSAAKSFVSGDFKGAFESMADVAKTYTDIIFKGINSFKDKILGVFNTLASGVSNIWEGIYNSIKSVVNSIISVMNDFIGGLNVLSFDVPDYVPIIGGMEWGFNIPQIPMLAKGGIVSSPTLAVIGEAGPEAVIPLDKLQNVTDNSIGSAATNNNTEININVDKMTVRNDQDINLLAKELYNMIDRKNRARGMNL